MVAQAPAQLAREEVAELYRRPLLDLVFEGARIHRAHHDPHVVQCSTLLSIKTGACQEDCKYCSQSAHNQTDLEREKLLAIEQVITAAKNAKAGGADRFCMGAAWRSIKDNKDFDRVLEMVREVKSLDLETCGTFGMLTPAQAQLLKEAGLDYYNHNLDTSPEYYEEVITTRTYDDRLTTLAAVRDAGMKVCCGGILGMGESEDDRIGLLHQLAIQSPPPESVPINALVPVEGTPLENVPPLAWDQMVRAVAVARILMPESMVRLSAGRHAMSEEAQAMCFMAGANSIFLGDQLLTTPNRGKDRDQELFDRLGLEGINESEPAVVVEV
ncbi:MAG: biotin synthase BioB [Planctomycetes bacterium]|nr:biotin synthase BioB [Planctomycetota bacterium]MCP4859766.1 biotin synthase BioB [Planctomycetota bacterium]